MSVNPQTVNAINNTEKNTFNITPTFSQPGQTIGENIAPTFTQGSGANYLGVLNEPSFAFSGTATATISSAYGEYVNPTFSPSSTAGTLTLSNAYGLYTSATTLPGANGVVTSAYSLFCRTLNDGTTNKYTAAFGSTKSALVGIGTATPNQALSVVGGVSYAVTTVTTATYIVLNTDNTLEVNYAGAVVLTLPAATSSNAGQTFVVKDASGAAEANPITISTLGGNIDGAPSQVIGANYGFIKVFSDGLNYYISEFYLSPPQGPRWVNVTGTSAALVYDFSYYTTNAAATTLSLPLTAPAGSALGVTGVGSGLWTITQGAGQQIQAGSVATTLGNAGSLASTSIGDTVWLVCTQANTNFLVLNFVGNLIVS